MIVEQGTQWKQTHGLRRRTLSTLALLVLCSIEGTFFPSSAVQAEQPTLEYQIKASMLFNFLQFVDWPNRSIEDVRTLTICTLGHSQVIPALEPVRDEIVKGHRVRLNHFVRFESGISALCDLLFISETAVESISELAPLLKENSVLTVGERSGFIEEGGIINFVLDGSRLKFEINADAAMEANLRISSKLIRLASKVLREKQ